MPMPMSMPMPEALEGEAPEGKGNEVFMKMNIQPPTSLE